MGDISNKHFEEQLKEEKIKIISRKEMAEELITIDKRLGIMGQEMKTHYKLPNHYELIKDASKILVCVIHDLKRIHHLKMMIIDKEKARKTNKILAKRKKEKMAIMGSKLPKIPKGPYHVKKK
jgi:hypothetical protein